MAEIRIPILVSGAEALRELDGIAKGTTSSLNGVQSASKSLQTTSIGASADIKSLTAALQANTAALQAVTPAAGAASNALRQVGSAGSSGATEARLAMKGLGTELGVNMPRFVASFLTSLGPVAGIMSSAFSVIAVVGLIEVLDKVPGAIQKMVDSLHGWDEAAKQTFEVNTKKYLDNMIQGMEDAQRIQGLQLIGKTGSDKYGLEAAFNSKDINQVATTIHNLMTWRENVEKIINWKPKLSQVVGVDGAPILITEQDPYSHAQREQAKIDRKLINESLPSLYTKERELSYEGQKIPFDRKADGATRSAAAQKEALRKVDEELARSRAFQKKQDEWVASRSKATWEGAFATEGKGDEYFDRLLSTNRKASEADAAAFLKNAGVNIARPAAPPEDRSADIKALQEHQSRMLGINSRPGEEAATAQAQAQLRLNAINEEYSQELKIAKLKDDAVKIAELEGKQRVESAEVVYSLQEKLAQIQKSQLEDYRKTAGEVFDALTAKGSHGLSQFFQAEAKTIEKQLFVNGSGEFYNSFKKAGIGNIVPGQTNDKGDLTMIGRLLQGTPFAKDGTSDIKLGNEYLNRNNILTQTNNEQLAKLNGNLNPQASSTAGGAGAAGGFTSALSTFAALAGIHGGSSTDSVVNAVSSMKYSAADVARAGFPDASSYDRALQVAEYKARAQMGQGDEYILAAAKGGLPTNPATGAAWAKDPRMNDTARQAIATGFIPISDVNRIPDPAVPSIPKSWFSKDLSKANDWFTHNANTISAAGTAGGMGFGAYEGFRQGTTRGDLAGSAAIVGGVTSLLGNPAIQKVIGSVASSVPIVGSVLSVGLGLVSSLLGNSAQERRDQMENEVKGSYDRLAPAKNQQYDITGYSSDITGAGSARAITVINNTTHIDAIDQKSIIDHWPAISEAVRMGVNQNHPVVDAIKNA
jgi:hypothetical protein